MTDMTLGILLGLVADDMELLALAVFNNGSRYGRVDSGVACGEAVLIGNGKNLFEGVGCAFFKPELFDEMISPSLTLYCFPPVSTIANIL